MHVLIVTTYFEPNQGAASILVTEVAKKLAAQGHQVTVLTPLPNYPHGRILDGYRGKFQVIEDRQGLRIIQTWLWATPSPKISRKFISQITFAMTAFLRGLAIPRPDVMLIVAHPMFTNFAGTLLSILKRTPAVLDIHDLWPDHMLSVGALTKKHIVYRIFRRLVDWTYHHAVYMICASPGWAAVINRYIKSTNKTQVVYHGVDMEHFRPGQDTTAFRQKYNLGQGKLVTFLGTFATQYDFEIMTKVAAQFQDRADVHFAFIGGGSQSDVIRQQFGSSLANVKWVNWIDYAEMPLAWCASDVTFWALRKQDLYRGTIPTKLFEAMASGTPIVAATEDVAAELIQESGGGFALPFDDVEGMVTAIRRLLNEPSLREQCARAGRAYAEQHFDVEQAGLSYETVLQKASRI